MGQWYNWQLYLYYHHVWWVVLYLKRVMRIMFSPQKHFKIGSSSKLHIHLKRELSLETMLSEIIPTTKHMLFWHSLMSVSLSSITNTGQNDFITRSLLWSNMVKCSTPSSAERFCIDLCGDHSMKVATTAQVTFLDTGWLLWGESLIFLYINTLFLTLKELLCIDMASEITVEMVSLPDSLYDLCCLYASKHLLPNYPQWTNCS